MFEQNFYILDEKYSGYAEAVYKDNKTEVSECSLCAGRKVMRISELSVYFKGKKQADFYTATNYSIISSKFLKILQLGNISGYTLANINSLGWYDGKGNPLNIDTSDLKELVVEGRCGYLRHQDGTQIDKCEKCGRFLPEAKSKVHGLSVDIDEWDKSDIFFFKNWFGMIIITQKVKDLLEQNKITNIKFQNIKDFKFI